MFLDSTKENCKNDREMTMCHSIKQMNFKIGYQNSADFCEMWPEHSLEVVKRKRVGDF